MNYEKIVTLFDLPEHAEAATCTSCRSVSMLN
jgi:hypothetical protein